MGAFNYHPLFSLFHLPLFRRMPLVFLVIVMPCPNAPGSSQTAIMWLSPLFISQIHLPQVPPPPAHRCHYARFRSPSTSSLCCPYECTLMVDNYACPFDTRIHGLPLFKPVISLSSLFIEKVQIIPSSGHWPFPTLSLSPYSHCFSLSTRSPFSLYPSALLIG